MRRVLLGVLAGIAGLVLSYGAAILFYVLYIELTGTVDREGAFAMGVAFVIGPAVALIGGIVAGIWTFLKFSR